MDPPRVPIGTVMAAPGPPAKPSAAPPNAPAAMPVAPDAARHPGSRGVVMNSRLRLTTSPTSSGIDVLVPPDLPHAAGKKLQYCSNCSGGKPGGGLGALPVTLTAMHALPFSSNPSGRHSSPLGSI